MTNWLSLPTFLKIQNRSDYILSEIYRAHELYLLKFYATNHNEKFSLSPSLTKIKTLLKP